MHVLTIPSWYPHPNNPSSGVFFKEQTEAVHRAGIRAGVIAPIRRSLRTFIPPQTSKGGPLSSPLFPTYAEEYFACPRLSTVNDWRHLRIGYKLYQQYVGVHGVPDLLHAHSALLGGVLAHRLSKSYGVPYLITEHSSAFGRGLLTKKEIAATTTVFDEARALVAVSPTLAKDLSRAVPSTEGKWDCIPNSIDESLFTPPAPQSHKTEAFTFLTIADFNKNKNIDLVIQALAKLPSTPAVTLRIGGDGAEMTKLRKLAIELDSLDRISFLGRLARDEVAREMKNCDAFVLASQYETFGVVLVEALAVGKPVIASACGGPESIVQDHNGILVPVGCIDSLREAMTQVMRDYAAYDSSAISKNCLRRFGSRAIAARTAALYRRVAIQ
jgi:teichuronic acid biosynthesis glycosyltransferase TuaC